MSKRPTVKVKQIGETPPDITPSEADQMNKAMLACGGAIQSVPDRLRMSIFSSLVGSYAAQFMAPSEWIDEMVGHAKRLADEIYKAEMPRA